MEFLRTLILIIGWSILIGGSVFLLRKSFLAALGVLRQVKRCDVDRRDGRRAGRDCVRSDQLLELL